MKPSGIGGMSVMEGVMMKNKDIYAVAVRKPDKEIAIETNTHKDFSDQVKVFKWPIFRGMLAFVDSLVIGIKVLNYSAGFFEEEEEAQTAKKKEKRKSSKTKEDKDFLVEEISITHNESDNPAKSKKDDSNALLIALAVLISIVLSVALFMVLPVILTNLFSKIVPNQYLLAFIEGIIRLAIFIGYILLASQMNDIKRVFMYHGAEHKTINCIEHGFELTVENVRWQSKQHKRCGTSFMLLVVLISLVIFMFLPSGNLLWRIASRILLVPFIAGISYEFIRLAGKNESKLVNVLSQPGLWMQGLTTKEPDDSMIEVAIKSVEAVFDWRAFLEKYNEEQNAKIPAEKSKQGNQNAKQTQSKQSNVKQNTAKQNTAKQNTVKQNNTVSNTKANPSNQKNNAKNNTVKQDNVKITEKESLVGKEKPKEQLDRTPVAEAENKAYREVKATVGGLAYTGKVETAERPHEVHSSQSGRNKGTAPVTLRPNLKPQSEEEDDEILKALDKYFDGKNQGED